ncbi:MAG TPA: lycopene cyclase domain-containing protein [Candidatus Omnitrophota bacterium]|jgi:lycopene cyclase domain-containing protein|nr:lycopene cyclase domain-containing protein [Candidatus Omnitrophota bacterium]HPN56252.1 lycopene cyclase domain-containing protein [Candidatus Omnitrophota bacterium]
MKEYTILAAASVLMTCLWDRISGVRVLRRNEFYVFLSFIFLLKLLVNGYLTGAGIVLYEPRFFLGYRLGSIPFEDLCFGFSLVTVTIVSWEYFKTRG